MVGGASFVFRIERDVITAVITRGRESERIGECSYGENEQLGPCVRQFAVLAREQGAIKRGDVVLGASVVQRRLLTELPQVRSAVLRELVQQQQKRFFRRNGRPLVTDAVWEQNREKTGRHVIALAVEERLVEAVVAAMIEGGLRVGRVTDEAGRFHLMPRGIVAVQRDIQWYQTRLLLIASGVALAAGLAGRWARLRLAERALDTQLTQLAPALAGLREARRRLGEAEDMVRTIDAEASTRGDVRQRLARIVLSLPDSAYLTSLALERTGAASLSGTAKEAAAVVSALEKGRGLRRIRLDGQQLIDGTGGRRWERFSILAGGEESSQP